MLYTTQVQILSLFIMHDSLAQALHRHTPNPLNLNTVGDLIFFTFSFCATLNVFHLNCSTVPGLIGSSCLPRQWRSSSSSSIIAVIRSEVSTCICRFCRGRVQRAVQHDILSPRQAGPSTLIQIIKRWQWQSRQLRQCPPVFTFSIWYWFLEI